MSTPESKLKDYLVAEIQRRGWMLSKTSTPHWPDWTVAARKGKTGRLELKAPGQEPTAEQYALLNLLLALGHTVGWANCRADVDGFLACLGPIPAPPRAAKRSPATSTPTTPPKRSQGLPTTPPVGALRLKQKAPRAARKQAYPWK